MLGVAAMVATYAGHLRDSGAHDVALSSWQVVNLIGAPMVAFLYLPAVLEDLQRWLTERRKKE